MNEILNTKNERRIDWWMPLLMLGMTAICIYFWAVLGFALYKFIAG
ncbi:MAG: hypothetical protein ABSB91_00360 [Sedimentisphaerales bacterium]|jgi:hypothetical protein